MTHTKYIQPHRGYIRQQLAVLVDQVRTDLIYQGRTTVSIPGADYDDCPVYMDGYGNTYAIHNSRLVAVWPADITVTDPQAQALSLGRALRRGDAAYRDVAISYTGAVKWVI